MKTEIRELLMEFCLTLRQQALQRLAQTFSDSRYSVPPNDVLYQLTMLQTKLERLNTLAERCEHAADEEFRTLAVAAEAASKLYCPDPERMTFGDQRPRTPTEETQHLQREQRRQEYYDAHKKLNTLLTALGKEDKS